MEELFTRTLDETAKVLKVIRVLDDVITERDENGFLAFLRRPIQMKLKKRSITYFQ